MLNTSLLLLLLRAREYDVTRVLPGRSAAYNRAAYETYISEPEMEPGLNL